MAVDEPDRNFNKNLHDVFNGVATKLEAPEGDAPNEQQEELSPKNKRAGSSKTSSRRNPNKVSPPEATSESTKKKISFEETYIHPHKRVIIELAILLKSNKAFEEFTKALMAFIENTQMVDPKFTINTLNLKSKEKSITAKGEISPNMTKLGIHVKISGNGNAFNKQKVWDKEEQGSKGRNNRKSNKKEEYKDPIVYFSMVVSSEVEPREIIDHVMHEWARLNGMHLQVKDLQFVDSETVVSIFKVSAGTKKEVFHAELKRVLHNAQAKASAEYMDQEKIDFSMDIDVPIGESLPAFNLKIQNAKLKGQDVLTFNKLSNRAQFTCKSWHVEVASKYANGMKELVQYAKDLGCVSQLWGRHAHLSKFTDQRSTVREAKRQVDVAQAHTNYQMSMMGEELAGVICLDEATDIMHVVTGNKISTLSLQFVLLNYLQIEDGHPTIAKVHQECIIMPTNVVIPNTPKAERILLMMNKNLPAFLWHMLLKQGLPKEFIKDLLTCICEASMLAEMHKCQWDEETCTLTTADKAKREKEVNAFESASWFKDEFGLLAKAAGKEKNYTTPEALYNLAGAGSVKTIHDRHEKSKEVIEKGKEANEKDDKQKKKKKKKDEVIELSSGESSGKLSASESSSSSTSGDSASQLSSDSEKSSSSDKRSHSKGRRGGKKSVMGAAQGR
jgi:hypothetical protein